MAKHGLTPVARDIQDEDQYNELFVSERLLRRPDARQRLTQHPSKAFPVRVESA